MRDAAEVALHEAIGRRHCRYCMREARAAEFECIICGDASQLRCPCSLHGICGACVADHMSQHHPSAPLRCPCGLGGAFDPTHFPGKTREAFVRWTTGALRPPVERVASDSAYIMDQLLVSRCPACNVPYDMFDGCAAVYCACQTWFCGLCLRTLASEADAHAHVANKCALNDEGSFFVSSGRVERISADRKMQAVWDHLAVLRRTYGTRRACAALICVSHVLPLRALAAWAVCRWRLLERARSASVALADAMKGAAMGIMWWVMCRAAIRVASRFMATAASTWA